VEHAVTSLDLRQLFPVRFHHVLAVPARSSFHIGYPLLNLGQASHLFSAFHSVFRYFIRRSHLRLTVFAAVPGISRLTLFVILLSAPWELICTVICCSVSISSLILFQNKLKTSKKIIPFITTFNPTKPVLKRSHWNTGTLQLATTILCEYSQIPWPKW